MKSLIIILSVSVTMILSAGMAKAQTSSSPVALHRIAEDYYNWRNQNYPVQSSDAGLHTWDHRLTDYSPLAIAARRTHVISLLARVNSMQTAKWKKDDRIDWLLLRSQLESVAFFDRVMDFEHADPQTYVNECSNAIFSLLKKSTTHRAIARCPPPLV